MRNRALLFILCSVVGASTIAAETVTVSAAASLTDAVREIAKSYEAATHDHVDLNFGASNLLERQIEEGAPVDLFLSADEASIDKLEKSGSVEPGSRRSILSNTLVVVVDAKSPIRLGSAKGLASGSIRALALAQPDSVPAGIYARRYLESLGLWAHVRPKVIPTENVRAALAAVEAGNADAAIVYRTDAGISRKIRIAYEVPAGSGPPISYGAAVIRGSPHAGAARKFLSFLESPASSAVFRRYGFLPRR